MIGARRESATGLHHVDGVIIVVVIVIVEIVVMVYSYFLCLEISKSLAFYHCLPLI